MGLLSSKPTGPPKVSEYDNVKVSTTTDIVYLISFLFVLVSVPLNIFDNYFQSGTIMG